MTPDRLQPSSEQDQQWERILNERPILGQLQTAKHVRNQYEIDDTWDFIDEFSGRYSHPEYIGLVGSRQVGKIFWSEEKLINIWKHSISKDSLVYLHKEILRLDKNFDGTSLEDIKRVVLPNQSGPGQIADKGMLSFISGVSIA